MKNKKVSVLNFVYTNQETTLAHFFTSIDSMLQQLISKLQYKWLGFPILFFTLSLTPIFAQPLDQLPPMYYTFRPEWKTGQEFTFYHQKTSLTTNERDMPVYVVIDSLYCVMKVNKTDSFTWILQIDHYSKYDKMSKTAYLPSKEPMKNAPILLEFDTAFHFLQLQNWQQWRDTLHKNLRSEFNKKLITLKEFDSFKTLYNDPQHVEEVVLNYYQSMFQIMGRTVDMWNYTPMVTELKNPFSEGNISKSGDEYFFILTESRNFLRRTFEAKTGAEEFEKLAEDYLNYASIQIKNANVPKPRVILKKDEYHVYDLKNKQLTEFRIETGAVVNGASTLLEYHLKLLNIR